MGGFVYTPEEQIRVAEFYHSGLRGDELKAAHDAEFSTKRSIHSLENAVYYKTHSIKRYAELNAGPGSTAGSVEWNPGTGILQSAKVRTLDEAFALADLDPDDWNVEDLRLKPYQSAQKLRQTCDGPECSGHKDETVIIQLMAMNAKLSPRMGPATVSNLLELVGTDIAAQADAALAPAEPAPTPYDTESFLLELSLPDVHLGKYSYSPETGDTMTIETVEARFKDAVRSIVGQALRFGNISRFLLPVGNDFLHVEADSRSTTRGTPQDVHGRWTELMRRGRRLLSEVIREELLPHAPVDSLVIRGNHSRNSEWALGELLAAEFENNPDVTFDSEPTPRKYYPYGEVLLGFTHGNEEKWADLPAIMAREAASAWGNAIYREWHVGHEHRRVFRMNEENECPIRMIPSLSGLDEWHNLKGYSGVPGAEGFLWRPDGPGPVIPYTVPRGATAQSFTGPKIDRSF